MKRAGVALVDEARCIGCARCIAACPVDAIAGAEGWMHTVIAAWCTGCELCVAPCPVDCIAMVPAPAGHSWGDADARAAKLRHAARRQREASAQSRLHVADRTRRRAVIAAALERAKAKRR
jgi:electron transport complex protein RnfB